MNSAHDMKNNNASIQSKDFFNVKSILGILFILFLSVNSFPQEFEKPFKIIDPEIIDRYKSLYKDRSTGDSYDPATGAVTFAVTDINIPGNSTIPVALSRWIPSDDLNTGGFGPTAGWYWDIPVIKANYMGINPHIPSTGSGEINIAAGGWRSGKNCTETFSPSIVVSNRERSHSVQSWFYWEGKLLHIPGKTTEKFLEAGDATPWTSNTQVTKSNYKVIECFAITSNQQGFVVQGPDGTKYTFGKVRSYYTGAAPPVMSSPLTTFTKLIMVTEIEDRFGNTVTYEYDGEDSNLSAIVGSDGRRIDLTYKPHTFKGTTYYIVDYAEANGKKWTYEYSDYTPDLSTPNEHRKALTKVVLPDGSSWKYEINLKELGFNAINLSLVSNFDARTGENIPGFCSAGSRSEPIKTTVTNPDQLRTEYSFEVTYHGRSKVVPEIEVIRDIAFAGVTTTVYLASNLNCSISYSLRGKTVSGVGIPTQNWSYVYSQNTGTYVDEGNLNDFQSGETEPVFLNDTPANIDDAEDYRTTTVTGPDSKTVYYIDRGFQSPTEGSVVTEDYLNLADDTLLKRVEYEYTKGNLVGKWWFYNHDTTVGPSELSLNKNLIQYRINKTGVKTKLYLSDGTDTYDTEFSSFDDFGFAGKTAESNDFSTSTRYTKNGYLHDDALWILGLPTTTEISADDETYTTVNELVYHSSANTNSYLNLYLPYEYKSYGTWIRRYPEFNVAGQVQKIIYNQPRLNSSGVAQTNTYRYQQFDLYKRGKAQLIVPPFRYSQNGGMTFSRAIDDDGLTTSITDLNGITASYGYDLVGRLKNVDLPGSWLDTSIEWQEPATGSAKRIARSCRLNADLSGCEDGTVQMESTSEFDALYRIVKSQDADLLMAVNRYQNFNFNSTHLPTFSSFKSVSTSESQGTTNTYDNLGRLTSSTLSNGGTITHEYLSGNKIKVTDAEANETTTTYLAYGAPEYSQMLNVSSPEAVTTTQVINIFGDITRITQDGPGKSGGSVSQTEYRAYDSQHHLCKVVRSDVGTTVFSNNLLGEVQWQAQGVGGGTVSDCDSNADDTNKIYFTYDNMGDLWKVNYPNSAVNPAPDITYTRDKNGNVKTLQAGTITQTYNYNILGLVDDETLSVDGKNLRLDYEYNDAGHLAYLTYPDGGRVGFDPNAFGEPRAAIRYVSGDNGEFAYASDAEYYPNGQINSFLYGNGLIHKTTLNSRQLPDSIRDDRAELNALHYSYTYDDNSRATSLIDHVDNNFSITNFTYDGLGRLTNTTGGTGIGSSSMRYDGLGNITYYQNKKRTQDYTYGPDNRLASVTSSGAEPKAYDFFLYDDRGNVSDNGYYDFAYNRANQMVESGVNRYTYDGHNRRVKSVEGSKTTYSFYSQSGKLLYTESTNGGINYIYLGNRLVAKEGIIPEKANKQHYLSFGESVEGEINDVGYTGHKFDKDIDLSYMQARYYDPVIGRFYSNDPVGFLQNDASTFNRYSYVGNDPINKVDPDGQFGVPINSQQIAYMSGQGISAMYTRLPDPLVSRQQIHQGAGLVSNTATGGMIFCAAFCQVALPELAGVAMVSGGIEAATSRTPAKDLAVLIVTANMGKKIEAAGDLVKGVNPEVGKEFIDPITKSVDAAVTEGVKTLVDKGHNNTNNAQSTKSDLNSFTTRDCSFAGRCN